MRTARDYLVATEAMALFALLSPLLMILALFFEEPEDSYRHQNW